MQGHQDGCRVARTAGRLRSGCVEAKAPQSYSSVAVGDTHTMPLSGRCMCRRTATSKASSRSKRCWVRRPCCKHLPNNGASPGGEGVRASAVAVQKRRSGRCSATPSRRERSPPLTDERHARAPDTAGVSRRWFHGDPSVGPATVRAWQPATSLRPASTASSQTRSTRCPGCSPGTSTPAARWGTSGSSRSRSGRWRWARRRTAGSWNTN
jgi:hypothetical protein